MTVSLFQTPIHRHDMNLYEVEGEFEIREGDTFYIINLTTKSKGVTNRRDITIPKTNTVQPHTSLFHLPDDLVFFPILHTDVGTFELIYIDSLKVYDRYLFY